ncbi:MAG TPA: type III pantothenate kinase [Turneriella sp.]|nr:type III pantothenate kinase [Turneriella sp.]HNL54236.1 type III pantothenate kinase [Turneriella sp.]
MTLTCDVGNSHSVVGLWKDGQLLETLRLATDGRRTADEWRIFLTAWLRSIGEGSIRKAAICSVVPAANEAIGEALRSLGVDAPHSLNSSSRLNFGFDYPAPQTLGADRIADMIAAVYYFGKNCVVLDFGTAITFSVVSDGKFRGGVIAPGITSSLEALFSSTAKLPKIAFRRTSKAIGSSTTESIEVGAYVGWRGVVREILSEIRRELPQNGAGYKVVATGGISESLDFAPEFFDVVDKNLTLKGLYLSVSDAY